MLHCITRLGLGGAERVALSLATGLDDRYEFGVFAVRGVERSEIGLALEKEARALGVPVHLGSRVPHKLGGMMFAGFRLAQTVRSFRPDALHLHTEIPEAAAATMIAVAGAPGTVIVRTVHNSVYWHAWARLGRWSERRLRRSHVACVSEDARQAYQEFRHRSGAGALPVAPALIYNGVAVPDVPPSPPPPTNTVRLLLAGRFEFEKGIDLLPEILARTPLPTGMIVQVVLHGQGRMGAIVRKLARDPPPGWRLEVHAPVPQLVRQLHRFDLVLMPSRFEGLGLTAIEATLAGVPVVSTDARGLREALPADHPWRARAGDAGSFAQALGAALRQRDRWAEVTDRARRIALERFNVQTMLERYDRLYARALDDRINRALRGAASSR